MNHIPNSEAAFSELEDDSQNWQEKCEAIAPHVLQALKMNKLQSENLGLKFESIVFKEAMRLGFRSMDVHVNLDEGTITSKEPK